MKLRGASAFSVAVATLMGCSSQPLDCSGRKNACSGVFAECAPVPEPCRDLPPGVSYRLVDIDTSPTPASIYVDGQPAGRTPLRHPLFFTNRTRFVIVVAEPLYPNQTRQERRIRVPPLPNRIQFFMNNPAVDESSEDPGR